MPFAQPTNVDHLPREKVQAFIDDLAALTARHGIVICSLAPCGDDIGGYLLATGGYLHAYLVGDCEVEVVHAKPTEAFAHPRPLPMTADIAGITAHDLVRRAAPSRRSGRCMMPASETAGARVRARDVAGWLCVLEAYGSRVPAISLLPGTARDLIAEETEPAQLVDACRRAIDAVDRQTAAERVRATDLCAEPWASAAIEQGRLKPLERLAILGLIRKQLAEIVASMAGTGPG